MPPIVVVNVSQTIAPVPATLQKSGAMISQGATTLGAGDYSVLTSQATLAGLLTPALALSSLSWSGEVVTVATSAPHGFTLEDTILLTISGVSPTGYNGTFTCTITGTSAFTYPLVTNPGMETVPGEYIPASVAELVEMNTTYWAQGGGTAVYVLELGAGNASDGTTALTTYLTENPNSSYVSGAQGFFYAYLIPREWSGSSAFQGILADYTANTAQTYFFVSATTGNYTAAAYAAQPKCAVLNIEAPMIASGEFSAAADFQHVLSYNPSSTSLVTPNCYSELSGVTAWPLKGNLSTLTALATANVNVVGTGAEGGISNTIELYGTTLDGNDFTYWYSVDWVQINANLDVSNAVINGSNNSQNPLYYNQPGVNRLQAVLAQTMQSAISYGLALGQLVTTQLDPVTFATNYDDGDYDGQVVVNAVPVSTWLAANPTDYATGVYGGFQIVYTPARGFRQIIINVNVSNLAAL